MLDFIGFGFIVLFGTLCYMVCSKKDVKVLKICCGAECKIENYMRLLIGPYFLWSIIEFIFMSEEPNFMTAKLLGLGVGIIVIPSFFFSYRTILKKGYDALDIITYVIAVLCAQVFSNQIMTSSPVSATVTYASLVILLITYLSYFIYILTPAAKIISKYNEPTTTKKTNKKK